MNQQRDSESEASERLHADEWIVTKGASEGAPFFIRANVGAQGLVGDAMLPYRLGIAIPFAAPASCGLPGNEEAALLDKLEDTIYDALRAGGSGILVFVITMNGMREFVSYVQDEGAAQRVILAAKRSASMHEVQHYVERDVEWDVYRELLEDLSDSEDGAAGRK